MGDCPNPECHERVSGHHRTLYGMDGKGGIVGCLNKYVKKQHIWLAVCAFGVVLFGTGIKVWFGTETTALIYATKDQHTSLEKRVTRNEDQFTVIRDVLGRIEKAQGEISIEQSAIRADQAYIRKEIEKLR